MSPEEIKAARKKLGLTQAQLARVLGYSTDGKVPGMAVSVMERATNPRPLPEAQRRLLLAYLDGYRPPDWPEGR